MVWPTTLKNLVFDFAWISDRIRGFLHNGFALEKKIIHATISSHAKVIDFGCGTGQFSKWFRDDCYVGIDIPGPHLCAARRRVPTKTFLEFDCSFNVPWKSHYFDWVLCFHVIHHVPPEGESKFEGEILRVLKRRGHVLLIDQLPAEYQSNKISQFLVHHDRGHFQRLPNQVIKLFTNTMRVKKEWTIRTGPYRYYVLILRRI